MQPLPCREYLLGRLACWGLMKRSGAALDIGQQEGTTCRSNRARAYFAGTQISRFSSRFMETAHICRASQCIECSHFSMLHVSACAA